MLDFIFDKEYYKLKKDYKNNFNKIQKDLDDIKTFIENIYWFSKIFKVLISFFNSSIWLVFVLTHSINKATNWL